MCGRFTLKTAPKRLAEEFGVDEVPYFEDRYNIAPTQVILGINQIDGERQVKELRWGLVPSWAKDRSMGGKLINARSETVREKPAFREAFKRRRCLIPADGFYEWQRRDGYSQPYYFKMADERPFALAGLWDRWGGPDGELVESCAILTTEANEVLRPVHDRMPVILSADSYDLWLDSDLRKLDIVKELLRPYPAAEMTAYPVSRLVNSPQRQGAELLNRNNSTI
ncbi:MAG: SOS response-associated peptidase [Acidobacteria bacterium]|nr:SOS response-associated peptidase [Acidobacteriota bacterium]